MTGQWFLVLFSDKPYVFTGTPKGVGFVRKPPIYLKHGDDARVWVGGGLGTLINTVVDEGKTVSPKAKM